MARLDTTTNEELLPKVVNTILGDNVLATRMLVSAKKWGSGQIFNKLSELMGKPYVAFGKTDNIPDDIFYVDKNNDYDWAKLPFKDNQFEFGYWDPPYDHLYKKEGKEIWRCCKKLAILHTYIWPRAWLKDSIRLAMIAATFGPMKQIRCLQIFEKEDYE